MRPLRVFYILSNLQGTLGLDKFEEQYCDKKRYVPPRSVKNKKNKGIAQKVFALKICLTLFSMKLKGRT